jgi:hypothetical protein
METYMRHFLLTFLMASLLPMAAAQGKINVNVNGTLIDYDRVQPQVIGDRVMVPLRGVLERLGAEVHWDDAARLVTARRGTTVITLGIGESYGTVDNQIVRLDVPAQLVRGRTLVPLRYLAEGLGAYVFWDAERRTVVVTTKGDSPVSPPPPVATELIQILVQG